MTQFRNAFPASTVFISNAARFTRQQYVWYTCVYPSGTNGGISHGTLSGINRSYRAAIRRRASVIRSIFSICARPTAACRSVIR